MTSLEDWTKQAIEASRSFNESGPLSGNLNKFRSTETAGVATMNNILNFFDTDSYKVSMWKQLPKGTTRAMSYIEARGGAEEIKFFGLQYILSTIKAPTINEVRRAAYYSRLHFGRDDVFNYDGWMQLAELGYLPLKVRSVREGEVYPTSVPLVTVENTIPGFEWLVTWFETKLLRAWYPTTVATCSWEIRNLIMKHLELSGTPETIGFKLHDFGARGVSSEESATIGSMAHLLNFRGTDTLAGLMGAIEYYDADPSATAFSIPASEHSTITSWGKDFETDAFRNMIEQFGGEGKIYACVSDSYDIWEALEKWKELEPLILEKGGTLVVRPDSGDPVETPVKVIHRLIELFGCTVNEKGYKVLPDHIRVIQGDGINYESISDILDCLSWSYISADNIAFGMGGALLQNHTRDDLKFAMKMCAITVDGVDRAVFKDPVTDPGKRSKKGYITTLVDDAGDIVYGREGSNDAELYGDMMRTVWQNGNFIGPKVNFQDICE